MENADIVLLTGPKHSGKTSIGRALAHMQKIKFYDLDELIETETGKSPRTLFREGAGIFRKAEADALSGLLKKNETCIAAAGGGLIDNNEAMNLLAQSPEIILINLEISVQTAWKRITENSAGGELPAFLDKTNPMQSHSEIHTRRARLYRNAARFTIEAEGKSPRMMSSEIINKLN